MAAYNTAANNTGPNGTSSDSDRAIPRIYVTNINNNSGYVQIGDNNVMFAFNSPPFSRENRSLNDEGSAASASSQQLYKDCKPEKRKEDSLVYEVSEFLRKKKRDRMRMKREKRNSRSSNPSSDDETPDSTLNGELALESGGNSSLEHGLRSFHFCSKRLHPLRDNGCWADFDRVAQELLKQTGGDRTSKSIISLEKSVALSYQRKLEESEDMLNDAVSCIEQICGSVCLLLAELSNCYRAALYRRKKMLKESFECLKTAKKFSSGLPSCLAVAIWLYEDGSCKRDSAATLSGSEKELAIAEAKERLQRCVDLCCRLDNEDVYVRKQHFALSKMASMNLRCETSVSRKENINSGNIEEAGRRLQTLRSDDYCKTEVKGAKIQRLKAEVDLYYRIEEFPKAQKIAKEALEIAERVGFNLEIKPLEDRLKDIRRKMKESSEPSRCEIHREIPRKTDSPHSSEYEVEEKLGYFLLVSFFVLLWVLFRIC